MPIYDLTCPNDHRQYDLLLKLGERPPCPTCGEPTSTLWLPKSIPNIIGDEIDIWIRHGLCDDDGNPVRYTSKEAIRRDAAKKGLKIMDDKPDAKPNTHKVHFT